MVIVMQKHTEDVKVEAVVAELTKRGFDVHRSTGSDQTVLGVVGDWSERLAKKSPALMRLGKDAMSRQQDMAFLEALDFLRAQLTIAFSTEDIQEGVKAFFEKREPKWTGWLDQARASKISCTPPSWPASSRRAGAASCSPDAG